MKRSIPQTARPDQNWCDAVRENIEHLGGAKGNRFEVPDPDLGVLTFSSPPTKAECEALEAKLNVVWGFVKQIMNRLDA
jgi:hypothetical protein